MSYGSRTAPNARTRSGGAEAGRGVLALVTAVRALRQRDLRPDPGLPVGRAFELAAEVLDPDLRDRPLTDDVTAAAGIRDRFTEL